MEMIKGIALVLVVLAGFSLFSLKMPKGMKAMGALAGAATASFLVEAFQLYNTRVQECIAWAYT